MADLNDSEAASAGGNQVISAVELKATPEHELKPSLVYLGHYLGLDVYIDVQPVKGDKKHIDLARRLFKKQMEEMN